MRKRDEISDPTSCLNKAKDNEWLFVLLGRDVSALFAVQAWIDHRIATDKNKCDDPKIIEAEEWIRKVQQEQARRLTKCEISEDGEFCEAHKCGLIEDSLLACGKPGCPHCE